MATKVSTLEKKLKERFVKAMATYRLISDGDRILVGLSGGKDSLCLLELLAQRSKIHHPRFEVAALHVRMANIEYETDTSYLQQFADELGVRLYVRETRFDASTDRRKNPCFLCSWYRRKELFNLAQEEGFNKIAFGHHQDDLIHTTLMNLFNQGRFEAMPVSLKLAKMPLTIIRPLCMIKESNIVAFAAERGYEKQKKLCPYDSGTNRTTMKQLFAEIESLNPEARANVWRALQGTLVDDGKTEEPI